MLDGGRMSKKKPDPMVKGQACRNVTFTDGRDSRMVSESNDVVRGRPRRNLSATALIER
jgi:hypothetical protein